MLRGFEPVVNLNAEVSDGTFDLRISEKKLPSGDIKHCARDAARCTLAALSLR